MVESETNAPAINESALKWAVQMADTDAADWEGFMSWLESDPANSERYDRVATALQDAALAATIPVSADINTNASAPVVRAPRRPTRWIGGTAAAALVGAIGFGVWRELPRPYVVETAAGENRTVTLADGSSVMLGGASGITLDHSNSRIATVLNGEVLFRVRHDVRHPFEARVGALKLIDLGTIFDVKMSRHSTRVAVAEGAVMADPDGAAVRLDPGQSVVFTGKNLRRQSIDGSSVGGWRDGRLAFDDAPLDEVAEDLSRQLARPVTASPSVAARTFRGTITVEAISNDPKLLGALLNVSVRQDLSGWTLEPRR